MKKQIANYCFYAGVTLISIPLQAQDLGLGNAGSTLGTQVEALFPWIAGLVFLFVAFKNWGNLVGEGGDVWKGIKNLILYVLSVVVVIGIYRYIKSQRL